MPTRSIGKQITAIARTLSRHIDRQTGHLALSSATVPFITYLFDHDGVHQDEMADNLRFDKSSAARAVKALVARGYATKVVDPANKRRNVVSLTERGRAIEEELLTILRGITDRLFTGFDDREIDRYFSQTERIAQNLEAMMTDEKFADAFPTASQPALQRRRQ